jgi:hypothetical protein
MVLEIRRHARIPLTLTALLLAAPGSPALAFDGLPFGSRLEVFALGVLVTASLVPAVRDSLGERLSTEGRRSLVKLVLVSLVFLKLLTFFRFPIGDRFEVCIKSTYNPIAQRCEKSFDYLFHSNDGVNGLGDLTRADKQVDYRTTTGDERSLLGASHSTWQLPFANEFPRFSVLWLDRLPFTARIGAIVRAEPGSLLPVEFTGDVRLSIAGGTVDASSYEFRQLLLKRLNSSLEEMVLDYSYTDDNRAEIPDEPPSPRGPYAHLVIAKPFSVNEPADLRLIIRGYAVNLSDDRRVLRIEARIADQTVVARRENRPDLAIFFGSEQHADSGFVSRLQWARPLADFSRIEMYAVLDDGSEQQLGSVEPPNLSADVVEPIAIPGGESVLTSDYKAWFSLGSSPELLQPSHRIPPSLLALIVFGLLNTAILGLHLVLLAALVSHLIVRRLAATAYSFIAGVTTVTMWFVLRAAGNFPLIRVIPPPMQTALVVGGPLWWVVRRRATPTVFIVGTSLTLGSVLSLEGLRRFTGLGESAWWGFMLFRDRPMDWFVFQGYAYQILVQQSLRGGEGYFYFMPGARYVIFLTHILFGNNDVLIGILVYAGFLAAATAAVWRTINDFRSRRLLSLATVGSALVLLNLAASSLSMQLAVGSASEVFAWSLFLVVGPNLRSLTTNTRRWWFGAALGLIVFLRPNYLLVSLSFLFGAMILEFDSSRSQYKLLRTIQCAWMMLGFVVVFSLMLSHNVYYAETFGLFTNRADPAQTVFEPERLFNVFSDPYVRDVVWQKIRFFLFWQPPNASGFQLASWLGQGLWLVAVYDLARTRSSLLPRVALLAGPLLYVVSSAPFGIMTIPERQTNMATLALAVSAIASLTVSRSNSKPIHQPADLDRSS